MRRLDVVDQLSRIELTDARLASARSTRSHRSAAAEEIVDALPDGLAELEVVDGAGHFTWLDAPDRYWATLVDFVDRVGAQPRAR